MGRRWKAANDLLKVAKLSKRPPRLRCRAAPLGVRRREAKKKRGLPATTLVRCPAGESSPLDSDPQHGQYSARVYEGNFHTDHLIPSIFFDGSKPGKRFTDLDFSYIHDPTNPEHAELVRGEPTDWHS